MSQGDWSATLPGRLARAASGSFGRAPEGLDDARRAGLGLRFIDRRERATYLPYALLWERCRGLAAELRAMGIAPGERVALMLPTSEDFPLAFFGAMLAGAVPVPLYPPVRLGRLDEYHRQTAAMLRQVGARLVLTDQRVRRVLGGTLALYRPALGCQLVSALTPKHAPEEAPRWQDLDADALAFIQFSSGTVSDPKPIALTHRQVLANATRILGELMGAYPESEDFVHAGVCWLPLYHDMGLVGCLVVSVAHPGELTLLPPELFVANPAVWLRAISRYRATISPAPNFAYSLCADRIEDDEIRGVDLSCWRVALNGAEPVTPKTLQRFVECFSPHGLDEAALTPVYGLAEATLAVTFSALASPFVVRHFDARLLAEKGQASSVEAQDATDAGLATQSLVSAGRPLPGFTLKVLDAAKVALPEGAVGRIWVRGPSIMRGYDGRSDLDQLILVDGWLDTGDEGFLHQGELFLYGRSKDIIILNGRNIAPQEIELAVDGVPGVRTGCVVALGLVLDEGERLHLFVEVDRAFAGELVELGEAVASCVSGRFGLGRPEVVLLTPGTIPRTSSGKLRRSETRRRYLSEELAPPKRVGPLLIAKELMRSWVPGRMGPR